MSASIRSKIASLAERITYLEAELGAVRAQKQQEEQLLSEIVYPFDTLPLELLSKILVVSKETLDDSMYPVVDPLPMRARLRHNFLLASVCRQWRDAVFGTCELWTRVSVHCGRVKGALDALNTWLPRSGGLPLGLSVRLVDTTAQAVWDILVQHSAQWQHIQLHTSESVVLSLANAAPILPFFQSLSIIGDVALEDGEHISAPNLHDLKVNTPFVLYQFTLPLNQITSLDLSGESGSGILEMLALMPNLTSLVLFIYELEAGGSSTISSCILSQLQSLQYNPRLPTYILAGLHTPLLRHLTFINLAEDFSPMQSLIARCGCSIRSLTIQEPKQYNSLLRHGGWLKGLPALQQLDLHVDKWRTDEFKEFYSIVTSGRSDDGKLCDLESITLRGCPRDLSNATLLGGLVERRWAWVDGMARVHTLRLAFNPRTRDTMEAVRAQLKASKFAGLQLQMWDLAGHPEAATGSVLREGPSDEDYISDED
ncbi:hypothetical protein C8F01DRAFT_1236275 [Mycena amicta]|nr:hypothetical protein C8F01DRAFT_1236275 [Mycena amicta]